MYARYLKRSFDLTLAVTLLIMTLPVMIAVAMAIMVLMGRPVFYLDRRPGRHQRPFTMIKFRTMRLAEHAFELDAHRITPLGRFLRRTSLDELPQLWNVLRGDMSLIGPRPLLWRYLSYYTPVEQTRHNVRPGISGWAQVNGRNLASWTDRLSKDVWYVHNQSFRLDIKILWMTLVQVVSHDQVVIDPHSQMLNLDEERSFIHVFEDCK